MREHSQITIFLQILLIFGICLVGTYSERIVGDRPFLSFTNEDTNIGVELGFSIPLLKVPLERGKKPGHSENLLSAPIEVNIPAFAVAATMFVATAAFVPKVFQLLTPVSRPPPTATEDYWRSDNATFRPNHWKSPLDFEKHPGSNDILEESNLLTSVPGRRSTSGRKRTKRLIKPHRLQPQHSCESCCNTTISSSPSLTDKEAAPGGNDTTQTPAD